MNPTASGIGISRLGQIAINAHDVDRPPLLSGRIGLKLLFKAPQAWPSLIAEAYA